MFKLTLNKAIERVAWGGLPLALLFLLIEFFDELNYGVEGAALPVLRADLSLNYAQIGLLLALPGVISTIVEPAVLLLGDTRLRKQLVVGGGLAVVLSLLIAGTATSFTALLVAFVIGYPASGAFVTLSQATLMDANPGREAQMMARWTLAGSLGNLIGPLVMAGGFTLALGWRWAFLGLAVLALLLVGLVLSRTFPARAHISHSEGSASDVSLARLLHDLSQVLGNRLLLRWIVLEEFADLLLDVFTGYAALYIADVIGVSAAGTSLLLGVLMLSGLLSDALLIPLLERFPGRKVVRASATAAIFVYAAWLLVPWFWAKVALLVLIRLSTLGWYPVLAGEAYATAPGKSGAVSAAGSLGGLLGAGLVWLVGWVANAYGLPVAMWMLLLGPFSLALFVPRHRRMGL